MEKEMDMEKNILSIIIYFLKVNLKMDLGMEKGKNMIEIN